MIPPQTKFNFLNLDIQGAEYEALKGLGDFFEQIHYIYTEVYSMELYSENGFIGEVDEFLRGKGFIRVGANINPKIGWGDALYIHMGNSSLRRRFSLMRGTFRFYFDLRMKHANRRTRNRIRKMLFLD